MQCIGLLLTHRAVLGLILDCPRDLLCKLLIALLKVSSTLIGVNLCLPSREAWGLEQQPGAWWTGVASSFSVTACLTSGKSRSQQPAFFPHYRTGISAGIPGASQGWYRKKHWWCSDTKTVGAVTYQRECVWKHQPPLGALKCSSGQTFRLKVLRFLKLGHVLLFRNSFLCLTECLCTLPASEAYLV